MISDADIDLRVVEGGLLDQDVEAIADAWNRNLIPLWLLMPQGVLGAIKRRAGKEPFRELGRMGMIPLGAAVKTGAGRLPLKAIIYVAGINLLWRSSESSIRKSVHSAMTVAKQNEFRSIAFPIIGSGSGGGKVDVPLDWMLDELKSIQFEGIVLIVR